MPIYLASMPRSGLISMRCRRQKLRWPSWARSRRFCGRRRKRHEVWGGSCHRCHGRDGCAFDSPGRICAEEGNTNRPERNRRAQSRRHKEITVARLDAADVAEDQAAAEIAAAIKGEGLRADIAFTGRCNLFAENAGVL